MELASKLKISSSRNSVTSGVSDAAREEAIASISSAWENMPGSDMTVSNRAGPRLADDEDNRTWTGTNGSPSSPPISFATTEEKEPRSRGVPTWDELLSVSEFKEFFGHHVQVENTVNMWMRANVKSIQMQTKTSEGN